MAGLEGRIGYVVNAFPVVSETFIMNEIRAMERSGLEIVVFALQPKRQPVEHAAVGEIRAPRIARPGWRGLLKAQGRLAIETPAAWSRLVARKLGSSIWRFLERPSRRRWRALRLRVEVLLEGGWIAAEARKLRVVHLHAHYAKKPLDVAEVVRRLIGLDYSFAAHAKDLYTVRPERLARRLRSARFAVTCHRDGKRYLKGLAREKDKSKVKCIRHGIDTELFRRNRVRSRSDLILAVGRLTPKKGFETLVDACALLARWGVAFRCEIIGQGRDHEVLTERIRALDLEGAVTIRRFCPQERLPAMYRRAAVLAMPCRKLASGNRDGVPNVVLEAMACATPVVGSNLPGLLEIIEHDRSGLLVSPGDGQALALALRRILIDGKLARRLGEAAAEAVVELDYRQTTLPLARLLGRRCADRVEAIIDQVSSDAWRPRGLAGQAQKLLGAAPIHVERVEANIKRAVSGGLRANAWRPDLERMVQRRMWDEAFKAKRVERLLSHSSLTADTEGPVLDLGCGRGGLSVALRARGRRTVGVDLRFRNCAVTRWRGRRYALDVPAATAVGEQLPFAAGAFAAVFCLEVLEHVRDPVALLTEVRRVLRPSGTCVVTVINRWAHLDPHYHLWGVNFLPRAAANRYIHLRKRTKESYRDCQTLDEMHYYTFGRFRELAGSLGFELFDVEAPPRQVAPLHALKRLTSLGFNSSMVVLRAQKV